MGLFCREGSEDHIHRMDVVLHDWRPFELPSNNFTGWFSGENNKLNTVGMTVYWTFLLEQSLAHFSIHLRVRILASFINNPVALRPEAKRRQSATHHVELKAVVLLHQTEHKHAESCNNMTNTV